VSPVSRAAILGGTGGWLDAGLDGTSAGGTDGVLAGGVDEVSVIAMNFPLV